MDNLKSFASNLGLGESPVFHYVAPKAFDKSEVKEIKTEEHIIDMVAIGIIYEVVEV
ncbi:hypothetical protein ACH5RR_026336, partial [Cinchona calisaya]